MDFYIKNLKHGGFRSFLRRAREMGVKITLHQEERPFLIQLEWRGKNIFCVGSNIPIFRRMGNLTKNKNETKQVLQAVGINVPRGVLIHRASEVQSACRRGKLRFPLITKPVDGSLAKGVTWNIQTTTKLRAGFLKAQGAYGKRKGAKVLIEEMFLGNEYRVLVFNGKVLSAVHKIPSGVTGDGYSTIKEVLHAFNKRRLKGFEIKLDAVARASLKQAGLTLNSVLPKGKFFPFRHNLNMSDGGRAVESTHQMDPVLKKICVRAVEAAGLTYGGIDLMTQDISNAQKGYVILEINPNPFYNMHEKPLVEGKGVDVSGILLRSLFAN